jgi:hypothetical protein
MTAILPRLGPEMVPASSRDSSTLMSRATPVLLRYLITRRLRLRLRWGLVLVTKFNASSFVIMAGFLRRMEAWSD